MNHHYADIRSRIREAPLWWDEHAVPRWSSFGPYEAANVYAREVALLDVRCQNCERVFRVAMSTDMSAEVFKRPVISALVRSGGIHYGDPPNVECCPSGPTMNSVPRRVLEFWKLESSPREWVRVPELEVALDPDWARDT